MRTRLAFLAVFLLWVLVACEGLSSSGLPTPLIITATPPQQIIIVTNTPSPSPSPVLAPTLEGTGGGSEREDLAARVETQAALQASATPIITSTPTFTPTPTNTPVTPGAFFQPVGGVSALTSVDCPTLPTGGFGEIFANNPDLAAQIGCPQGGVLTLGSAFQNYERGVMVWVSNASQIYAIYNNGSYQRFSDSWLDGVDPVSTGANPPAGLIEPIRGFGKIWREVSGVSDQLGWATTPETGGEAFLQIFERGEMLYSPQNGQTYILSGNTWTSIARPF